MIFRERREKREMARTQSLKAGEVNMLPAECSRPRPSHTERVQQRRYETEVMTVRTARERQQCEVRRRFIYARRDSSSRDEARHSVQMARRAA